ncbi:hypothetical protein GXP67_14195 [Rhodocytophaga rosea]|uniref:Uncharacterized protein n=1 Tax=Rhodocytophaga rosea TaxID=2704465 RepID=A0A6C0GI75_9BACT|nr:hypothetical protein [Rhodocytophaga rosea]QHT67698.1 hypothetical protein GXP67_14195 [Rhodocytophaga rosea]
MQRAISILLIFCVLMQSFSRLSIIAGYELNKDIIARVLCINKAEPENTCQGKCYLAKQLKQADKHEHLPSGNVKAKADVLFIHQGINFRFTGLIALITPVSFYLSCTYTAPSQAVFTPPKV